ncbi:hypothetical protein [Nonomuraea basaltis]|uniref:hypothetical protein n=1 Tax=Nonomuraea basaltis TaxID=2495887 RepID=UPI00110C6160|nr:hypothetical protein [Nonomuraea basaltis]TMR87930.1 hypothetical protein EJK15_69055 [Nonomuraea basaltis]
MAKTTEEASDKTKVVDQKISDEFLVATLDKATLKELKTDDRIEAIYEDRQGLHRRDPGHGHRPRPPVLRRPDRRRGLLLLQLR